MRSWVVLKLILDRCADASSLAAIWSRNSAIWQCGASKQICFLSAVGEHQWHSVHDVDEHVARRTLKPIATQSVGAGRAETPLSLTLFVENHLGELIEALFALTPEGHVFVQELVEPRTVVVLLEMAEFVQDDVVNAVSRGLH